MFIIDDIAVAAGLHYLATHGGAVLAAKAVAIAHHPVSTATTMAVHRGVQTSITNAVLSQGSSVVPAAVNVVHIPVLNPAVLSHGTASATGAATALHEAVKFCLPVAAGVACQLLRRTERYQDVKNDLSVLFGKALTAR